MQQRETHHCCCIQTKRVKFKLGQLLGYCNAMVPTRSWRITSTNQIVLEVLTQQSLQLRAKVMGRDFRTGGHHASRNMDVYL
jgi:hypothetical protein